jgi:hypothetical protein
MTTKQNVFMVISTRTLAEKLSAASFNFHLMFSNV